MNIILILFVLIFIVYNLIPKENFFQVRNKNNSINSNYNSINSNDNSNNSKDFDDIVVRCKIQKIDFDWKEPYNIKKGYESIGTGFFIDNKGHLLTNYHVVSDSIKVNIQLPKYGNGTYECDIISVYPKIDVALLKVKNYKNKGYFEFDDSDLIKKGDESIVLGYPLGLDKLKMTSGIISGFQDGDIQTDSPINSGNSGGPLINKNNKVIGINYAAYDEAQNVGFAIPINYVKVILQDMKKNKFINYPVVGANFNNSNTSLLNINKNDKCKEGYFISNVFKGGSFDSVGIKPGDVLCSFDNLKVDNFGEMFLEKNNSKFFIGDYLNYKKVGDKIDVKILRDNKIIEKKNVELKDNTFYKIRDMFNNYDKIDYQILGGLVMMELSNNHFEAFKKSKKINMYDNIINKTEGKLIITHVINGSKLSDDQVFHAPLILSEVNGNKVSNLKELRNELNNVLEQNKIKYFSFLTEDKKFLVLGYDECKKEELFLSKKYNYKLTPFTKKLLGIK